MMQTLGIVAAIFLPSAMNIPRTTSLHLNERGSTPLSLIRIQQDSELLTQRQASATAASAAALSSALRLGFDWCTKCVKSSCSCNALTQECIDCKDYASGHSRPKGMPFQPIAKKLTLGQLTTLADGGSPGEYTDTMSPNGLDGNLQDRRRRQTQINALAAQILEADENKQAVKAQVAANILYQSPLLNTTASQIVGDIEDLKPDEQAAQDAADAANDRVPNQKLLSSLRNHTDSTGSASISPGTSPPFDCSKPLANYTNEAAVWCSGRHLDGRPAGTDSMLLVTTASKLGW